jgi:hypothetical protein
MCYNDSTPVNRKLVASEPGRREGFFMRRIGGNKALALFVMAAFAASIAVFPAAPAMAQTTVQQAEFQLVVIPMASKLPADSGEYPVWIQLQTVKGASPVQATADISIMLSTSDDSIIKPRDGPTLLAGESMVMGTIATTAKAGAAEITAIAEGISVGKASVSTVALGSLEPSILSINAGSGEFIPNPAFPGKLYVQLLNSANVPTATKASMNVYLSSSNPKVGSVPFFVTIPAGSSGVLADFTPTSEQGTATLTASANGFSPGEVEIETVGPAGSRLVVEMAPSTIPAPFGYYSYFTVQIQDSGNIPVKADKPITVTLSSSNTNIMDIPSAVTIPAGSSYAMEKVKSRGTIGSATISASAQGLSPGSVTVNMTGENWGDPSASKLISVSALPTKIAPDNTETANIIVQVTDSSGRPYSFQSYHYTLMDLTSSDPSFVVTSEFLKAEATFAVGTVKSPYEGSATIAASRNSYMTGSAGIESRGSIPIGLEVAQLHEVILANNVAAPSVILGLVDAKGNPTFAQKDVVISLSSSDTGVATVELSEFIPKGKYYALVDVNPIKAGTTTITASAAGLASGSIDIKTVGSTGDSSSYKLAIQAPTTILADGNTYGAVFVQLQNSAGNPVPADSDIRVSLSSSSASAASVENSVTINAGSTFAVGQITPTTTPSKFKVSASSTGYTTVSTDITTSGQALTIVRTTDLPRSAQFGEKIKVGVDVFAAGLPVEGALVQIGGNGAEVTEAVTDANGHAEGMYIPTEPGRTAITVTASKPGYKLTTASYPITLDQTVDVYVAATTEAGKPIAVQAKITGSNTKTVNVKAGVPSGLDDVKFGTYKVGVPDEFTAAGARYTFVSWADGVTENPRTETVIRDSGFTAVYSADFLLAIATERGTVTGSGYYPEGSIAAFSISQTSFDGFPIDQTFAGWSGDVRVASPTGEVTMDGPKTITAEWSAGYIKLIALLGAAGGGGFVAYFKVLKPKKEAIQKAKAPDLDWYKK